MSELRIAAVSRVRFEEFDLDLATGELRGPDLARRLPPQPLKVLALLVSRPGELVPRDEIRRRIWSDGTFVDFEQGLNYCIRQIRAALRDPAETPRFIETVPRRGYRFVARVKPVGAAVGGRVMLAVLPFENLSGDPSQDFFSDGLTDEMIAQLGRLNPQRLGVIARTSAMRYKHTDKGIDVIGRELGVGFVLEGSVRRSSTRVRVNGCLIQVSDQTQIWADSFERPAADILALQDEVARMIAARIGVALAPGAAARAGAPALIDPGAYEAYLQGRHFWKRRSREALEHSVRCFNHAIVLAPEYVNAYAGLADVHLTRLDYSQVPPSEAFTLVERALMEASRLDHALAEPHSSLGHLRLHQFKWSVAEQEFGRAIALNPGYDAAHYYYANLLAACGRFETALTEAESAIELDPVSANTRHNRVFILYLARRYDEALALNAEALALEPSYTALHYDLGLIQERLGRFDAALEALDRVNSPGQGRGMTVLATRAFVHARAGRRDLALEGLHRLEALSASEYVSAYDLALLHFALDDTDAAMRRLSDAYDNYSSFLPFLNVDARWDSLRSDSRFQALAQRLNLPAGA